MHVAERAASDGGGERRPPFDLLLLPEGCAVHGAGQQELGRVKCGPRRFGARQVERELAPLDPATKRGAAPSAVGAPDRGAPSHCRHHVQKHTVTLVHLRTTGRQAEQDFR